MTSTPRFLQGIYGFEGQGLEKPFLIHPDLSYVVPMGLQTQPVYLRAGNSSAEFVFVVLMRDGEPMRYFPVAAKGGVHVSLRVVEDLDSDTVLELWIGAPEGVNGTVVVDLGLVEV